MSAFLAYIQQFRCSPSQCNKEEQRNGVLATRGGR